MAKARTVICFCKYPEPGMVKSRLSTNIGEDCAVQIYKIILENILQNICMREFEVALYCFPDINHSFFEYCREKYNVSLHYQDGNDLGLRMYNAISNNLCTKNNVILIGSDCLELDSDYINDAFLTLDTNNDIVLGPTLDGGYALIGANRIDESIFCNVTWGTDSVLQQTVEKIKSIGWDIACMPYVRDIDTLSDYQYFSEHKNFKHLFIDINKKLISTS